MLRVVTCAVVCTLVVIGCGGDGLKRVQVRGKVTAKGGVPVDNASVQFIPAGGTKGEGGLGITDDSGNYTMEVGSRQGDKGVVPGQYNVLVSRYIGDDGKALGRDFKQADFPSARESVPQKYSAGPSPIKVNVSEAGGEINIEIVEPLIAGKKR